MYVHGGFGVVVAIRSSEADLSWGEVFMFSAHLLLNDTLNFLTLQYAECLETCPWKRGAAGQAMAGQAVKLQSKVCASRVERVELRASAQKMNVF